MKNKPGAYDTSKPAAASKENLETDIGLNTNKREDLVKLFAQTKKKLDKMGQDLAFLSIDVADSTGMKVGEEKASIEHDFMEYKHIVEKAIKTHGSIKSAWTPDGVMICFPTIEGAVNTARDIIKGLKDFNANVKTIKKDFTIRCGVNFGRVFFD